MKTLIIGCNGLLGQNLLRTRPASWDVIGAGLEPHRRPSRSGARLSARGHLQTR